MIYLSLEQIIELHDALIEKFGGLIGIRERGLLESAVAAPMMAVFGEELHKTIYNKAAAYLFYIAKNHAFLDGRRARPSNGAAAQMALHRYDISVRTPRLVETLNSDRHSISNPRKMRPHQGKTNPSPPRAAKNR